MRVCLFKHIQAIGIRMCVVYIRVRIREYMSQGNTCVSHLYNPYFERPGIIGTQGLLRKTRQLHIKREREQKRLLNELRDTCFMSDEEMPSDCPSTYYDTK